MRTWMGILGLACAFGVQAAPKVAVTDLAYQERVEQYIHIVSSQNNSSASLYNANSSSTYNEYENSDSYIEQTELRKFSGDIKGEILKSGMFQLIQGKPYITGSKTDVYDIIERIKAGDFHGADYVLFGTLSDIDFQSDASALDHTNSASSVLGLSLTADFSLIDTSTYEITSAFTAMGEGQDTKLVGARDGKVSHNRPRVVREVSKELGMDVARQMAEQLGGAVPGQEGRPVPKNNLPPDEPAKILR
ncbi:MAG TPA: penicillin-binding protein activator LpoB [Pseudomonas sp.]|nr:penicillin-binding protein activator LpoB [Pseudomonas sp.]